MPSPIFLLQICNTKPITMLLQIPDVSGASWELYNNGYLTQQLTLYLYVPSILNLLSLASAILHCTDLNLSAIQWLRRFPKERFVCKYDRELACDWMIFLAFGLVTMHSL